MHDRARADALWAAVSTQVERVAAHGQTAARERRAHPGTSAHLHMARIKAKQEARSVLDPLAALLLAQAPAHWDLNGWGFSLAANMRDLRWDARMGKGRASWSNRAAMNSATGLAAFAGRVLAAFDLARDVDTQAQPRRLFRFAEPHRYADQGIAYARWVFRGHATAGYGPQDAFAVGVHTGFFSGPTHEVHPKDTFHATYRFFLERYAEAVPSMAPDLMKQLLAHPKAKALMEARILLTDSRPIEIVRNALLARTTVEANPTLATQRAAVAAARGMDTHLTAILDVLDGLGKPPRDGWRAWTSKGGTYRQAQVWAWDLASASAAMAIDDLEMAADARPPAHHAGRLAPAS